MAKDAKIKILVAARKLFPQKNYDGCSVALIAEMAAVNKASIE